MAPPVVVVVPLEAAVAVVVSVAEVVLVAEVCISVFYEVELLPIGVGCYRIIFFLQEM